MQRDLQTQVMVSKLAQWKAESGSEEKALLRLQLSELVKQFVQDFRSEHLGDEHPTKFPHDKAESLPDRAESLTVSTRKRSA